MRDAAAFENELGHFSTWRKASKAQRDAFIYTANLLAQCGVNLSTDELCHRWIGFSSGWDMAIIHCSGRGNNHE